MKEKWKPIKNYENYYEISNLGNVKSLDRKIINNKGFSFKKGIFLIKRNHTSGYYQVCLCKKGIKKYKYIHRLVAEHFLKNYDELLVINHLDGNKLNNIYTNIECCTQKENIEHAIFKGLMNNSGENAYQSKLTNNKVLEIRKLFKEGKTLNELLIYNVSKATLSRIINNKIWKNI